MMYHPKLGNGKLAPLSWPIAMFRIINGVCWPVEDQTRLWCKCFSHSWFILFLIVFIQHNEAEMRYIYANVDNLDRMLKGIPVYIVHIETGLCCLHIGMHKQQLKELLQKFYADIYIAKSTNSKIFKTIRRKLRPTFMYSSTYTVTLVFYVATPFISLINKRRDLLYDMIYPFDITPLYLYLPMVFSSVWFSFITCTMLFGEANIMSEIMLHLNGRYLLLEEDLQRSSRALLQQPKGHTISRKFTQEVKHIIQRNVELNEFAAEFQTCFSFRVFMIFSFAAVLLCVVGFTVYTNFSENIAFVVWMVSKILEMLAFGDIGSTLIATTNDVSSMYYKSNWELIISTSTNSHENIQLMKLLITAIETNRKPFVLMGLNFFSVSLSTVLIILRGAASYFTCLISFHTRD